MTHDVLLAGAGLANGLIALALRAARPDLRVLLLDHAAGPSDGHTWSCHDPDLSPDWLARLKPLRRANWPDQEVLPPCPAAGHRLRVAGRGGAGGCGGPVGRRDPLEQRHRPAGCAGGDTVLRHPDRGGRGPGRARRAAVAASDRGFRKFVGVEIETDRPHGVPRPMIMDATVTQQDGYRFIYLLPFSPTRILIEDTRYSDGGDLDDGAGGGVTHAGAPPAGLGPEAEVRANAAFPPEGAGPRRGGLLGRSRGGACSRGTARGVLSPGHRLFAALCGAGGGRGGGLARAALATDELRGAIRAITRSTGHAAATAFAPSNRMLFRRLRARPALVPRQRSTGMPHGTRIDRLA